MHVYHKRMCVLESRRLFGGWRSRVIKKPGSWGGFLLARAGCRCGPHLARR
jgi:hypothetical protein